MIKGYRELTENEIDTINSIKETAEEVGAIIEGMTGWNGADQRWVAIAKTDLQKGFLALVRAVAQPESF